MRILLWSVLLLVGCSPPVTPCDAGCDGGSAEDAGFDAGLDAGADAGADAGLDAGVDAGVDGGVDAGVSRRDAGCVSDFLCDAGTVCVGACVAAQGCVDDVSCQSTDSQDRCYRFGRQCTCDTVCRVRKAPCDECTADSECGSNAAIFGPPDGLGAGRCSALPNDASGRKYCRYQAITQCGCGLVDDGAGFCRPSSNSCAVVACDVDSNCPSNNVCNVPDGGASCSGTSAHYVNCALVNPGPVPRLTACEPSQLASDPDCLQGPTITASFSLVAITPNVVTLSGAGSTDDSRVAQYKFTLLPPIPGGATTAALANHGVRITANKTTLTIPGLADGTYRIGMQAYDDCGQASAVTAIIVLNISL